MSATKKMHFVPKTYLRKFANKEDEHYWIHLLHKKNFLVPLRKPVRLRNICAEKYLYSVAEPGQKNDAAVEDLLAKIFDAEYNNIYKYLTNEGFTALSSFDLYSVIVLVSSMLLRNRLFTYFLLNTYEEKFVQSYAQAVQDGENVFFHRNHEIPIVGKSLEELKATILPWDKPYVNCTIFPNISDTALKWFNESIVSLVTLNTDAEFITSDNPVTTEWSRDEDGILNGGHVRCIPLDSKHLLKLSQNHSGKNQLVLHRIHIQPEHEYKYALARNQLQLKLCSLYVLGNQLSLGRFQDQMRPILKEIYG